MQLLATFAVAQLEGVLFHVIWAEGRYLMPDRGPTQIHPIAYIDLRKNLNWRRNLRNNAHDFIVKAV